MLEYIKACYDYLKDNHVRINQNFYIYDDVTSVGTTDGGYIRNIITKNTKIELTYNDDIIFYKGNLETFRDDIQALNIMKDFKGLNIVKDFKGLNIVVIPTDDKSVVSIDINLNRLVHVSEYHLDYFYNQGSHFTQHLYLVSDVNIKNGDWVLDKYNQTWKISGDKMIAFDKSGNKRFSTDNISSHECRKIEKTTNISLKDYNVHIGSNSLSEFTDEFLIDFCKKSKMDSNGNLIVNYTKESWTREEVEALLYKYFMSNVVEQSISTKEWIKQNL